MSRQKTKLSDEGKHSRCRQIKTLLLVLLACSSARPASIFASTSPAWANVMLTRLTPTEADQVRRVIEDSTLQESVDRFQFRSQPAVYEFLLDHPGFAAAVARELHIARYRITPRPDGSYDATDVQGIRGSFRPLHIEGGERIYSGVGAYRPHFLPAFSGHAVVRLRYQHRFDSEGQPIVENRAELYIRLDNQVADFFAKLLTPFLKGVVDQKVNQAFTVAKRVSEQILKNPAVVYHRLRESSDLDRATLESFRHLLNLNIQEAGWKKMTAVC